MIAQDSRNTFTVEVSRADAMQHEDYDNHMHLRPAWLTECPMQYLAA